MTISTQPIQENKGIQGFHKLNHENNSKGYVKLNKISGILERSREVKRRLRKREVRTVRGALVNERLRF